MTWSTALLAVVATVNPLRLWSGIPGSGPTARVRVAALGAALMIAVCFVVMASGSWLLDRLEISDPTARIAAGAAIVVVAVRDAFSGPARPDPSLPGDRAALVPMALPHLGQPGLVLLSLSASVDLGVAAALSAVLVGLATLVALAWWAPPEGPGGRAVRGGHVLLAGLAVALGAALMLDGVIDI